MRGIRLQLSNLVAGMSESDVNTMALGLSHSLSRYKLKFSPDKVDTMIVQAICMSAAPTIYPSLLQYFFCLVVNFYFTFF